MPVLSDVRGYNRRLMHACLELSRGKPHWRLVEEELSLFEDDKAALQTLPPQELPCVRWEQRKCNKQGVLTLAASTATRQARTGHRVRSFAIASPAGRAAD